MSPGGLQGLPLSFGRRIYLDHSWLFLVSYSQIMTSKEPNAHSTGVQNLEKKLISFGKLYCANICSAQLVALTRLGAVLDVRFQERTQE